MDAASASYPPAPTQTDGQTKAGPTPEPSPARFSAMRLAIPDVILVRPRRLDDARGYFMETYRASAFADLGITARFVQDNQSYSARRGTIRGLHFQVPPASQAKLVRVLRGAIFDVAVDLRRGSETYGKWVAATLTAAGEQLFVPAGFAHGYCTLEPDTEVAYKCEGYHAPSAEGGIHFADPTIGIEWPVAAEDAVLSERDRALPPFSDFVSPFTA